MSEDRPGIVYDGIEYFGKGTKNDPYIWEEDGRIYIDNRTKWLPCQNDWLIVHMVMLALKWGFPHASLPKSVQKLMNESSHLIEPKANGP
jgi:hypothetical protein